MRYMECNKIEKIIWGVFDKEASADEKKVVKEHISTCESCRKIYDEVNHMLVSLKRTPSEDVPANFAQRLRNRIATPEVSSKRYFSKIAFAFGTGLATVLLFLLIRGNFVSPVRYVPPQDAARLASLYNNTTLIQDETGYLRLDIRSKQDLEDITLEITLSDGIILANGKKSASWSGDLKKGQNIIILKVKGEISGISNINGLIKQDGRQKSFTKSIKII